MLSNKVLFNEWKFNLLNIKKQATFKRLKWIMQNYFKVNKFRGWQKTKQILKYKFFTLKYIKIFKDNK